MTHQGAAQPVSLLGAADGLDRQSGRRGDTAYLIALVAAPQSQFLLIHELSPVLRANTAASGRVWFTGLELASSGITPSRPIFLGREPATHRAHFAVSVSSDQVAALRQSVPLEPLAEFRTLAANGAIAPADVAQSGLARSLFAWHDATAHCGWCGSVTALIDGGWKRYCAPCAKDTFPRVDPVVIMLVTDGERCVLAHEPRYPERMFSTIAGYLEPGEDIAHAVTRETLEELGLAVGNVSVHASQPWPFPHSLMIGCIATVAHAPLVIDTAEIVEARWFTRAETAHMLAHTHPEGLWVPGAHAIAHHLIRAFGG